MGIVLIIFGLSGCTMHRNIKLAEIIMDGHDPIIARMALNSGTTSSLEYITALLSINKKQDTDE